MEDDDRFKWGLLEKISAWAMVTAGVWLVFFTDHDGHVLDGLIITVIYPFIRGLAKGNAKRGASW